MLSSKVLQGLEHDWQALFLIHRFGWLRAHEMARFLWPNNSSQHKYGERLMRKLADKQFVLQRRLPHRAGMANVLSKLGAEHLQQGGIENARTGKDIGSISGDQWTAPRDWKHSLLVAGFLGLQYEFQNQEDKQFDFEFVTELEIKQNIVRTQYIDKVPDALFINDDGQWTWLEVENTRKSGKKHMGNLAKSLIKIDQDEPPFFGKNCTEIAIAYPENSINEFGHQVNHFLRINNAISAEMTVDERIWIDFYALDLQGFATIGFTYAQESISGRLKSPQASTNQRQLEEADLDTWDEEFGDQYDADYDLYEPDLPYHKVMISKTVNGNGKFHWKFIRDARGIQNANPSQHILLIEFEGFASSLARAEEAIFKTIQAAKDGTLKPQKPFPSSALPPAIEPLPPEKEPSMLGRLFGKK